MVRKCNKILGHKTIYDNLKIKHYNKLGEICPICLEEIWSSKEEFLTDCGHIFHKNL